MTSWLASCEELWNYMAENSVVVAASRTLRVLRAKIPIRPPVEPSRPARSRQARSGEDSRHDSMGRENNFAKTSLITSAVMRSQTSCMLFQKRRTKAEARLATSHELFSQLIKARAANAK